MNLQGMADAVVQLLKQLGSVVLYVAQRYWVTVIAAAVVVTLLATTYSWFRDAAVVRYTMLDGPAGGTGRSQSAHIATTIAESSSLVGFTYDVDVNHTNGYEENYQRIRGDTTGKMFGFAMDGFDDGENVRVLLPLESSYLHIIARRDFIKSLPTTPEAAAVTVSQPIQLSDVYSHLKPGRVFLGPKGSGTYQAARLVLGHYVSDPEKFQSHGIADWNDMRAAFHTGAIDLAFYSGPLGSTAVTKVARDGTGTLLDLGDDAATLCQTRPYLGTERILKNSYANGHGFCTHHMQTVTMRRVLICSKDMHDSDAWFLTKHVNLALRPSLGDLHLPEHADGETIRYLAHDGAIAYWKGNGLSYLPPGFYYFLLTVGLAFLVEVVRFAAVRMQAWVNGRQAEQQPATQDDYETLHEAVEELQDRIELLSPASSEQRLEVRREVRGLRQRIELAAEGGHIAPQRREALLAGLRAVMRVVPREEAREASAASEHTAETSV